MAYRKTVLENGITIVTDLMQGVRSVSLGLWFNVGSRDERADQAGLTHFMEHMMFKGTPTRTAFDISSQFDALGAELNAFTSREYTCYYARVVDEKLDAALPILADMVINSEFSNETIEPEREVVIEEIARAEDQPDDVVYDLFFANILPDHPLGLPVLGTREHVSGYQQENCLEFHREHYVSGNLTVAAAGNVDHDHLVDLCNSLFADMPQGPKAVRDLEGFGDRARLAVQTKDIEQAHILYGMPFIPTNDPRRFAASVMSNMLGGTMSSRLFQEVREKNGLVYSVFTSQSLNQGLGTFAVYAGTRPENIKRVIDITRTELAKMAQDGTDSEELSKTVEGICGQLLLGLESSNSRMIRAGRGTTMGNELLSPEEIVEHYRSVTCEDVKDIAQQILTQEPTIAVVSPYDRETVAELAGIGE